MMIGRNLSLLSKNVFAIEGNFPASTIVGGCKVAEIGEEDF